MDRWQGKVAIVTGANSGIGAEISVRLVKHGMQVIAVDMFTDQIKENGIKLKNEKGSLTCHTSDLTNDDDVDKLFDFVEKKYGVAHVIVNTAGIASAETVLESSTRSWRKMMDINVIATTNIMKQAICLMRKNDVDDGHIVNFASVAGHRVQGRLPFYSATKFAVRAVSEAVRQELREMKSKIRITIVSPGLVQSALYKNSQLSDEWCDNLYSKNASICPGDIAATVEHMLAAPQHVQITEAIVMPTGQIFGPM